MIPGTILTCSSYNYFSACGKLLAVCSYSCSWIAFGQWHAGLGLTHHAVSPESLVKLGQHISMLQRHVLPSPSGDLRLALAVKFVVLSLLYCVCLPSQLGGSVGELSLGLPYRRKNHWPINHRVVGLTDLVNA